MAIPVLAYLGLGLTGTPLHFERTSVNLLAHGLVVLVPVIWSSALLAFPARGRDDRDAVIVDAGPFHATDRNWHQGVLLLPGLVLALWALGSAAVDAVLGPGGGPATSGWVALLFSLEVFVFLVFYGSALTTQRWLAAYDEGVQVGAAGHAFPWDRVKVRRAGGAWDIHVEGVRFGPLAGFRPDPERSERFERLVEEHDVPLLDGPVPGERLLEAAVAAGTLVLLWGGAAVWKAGAPALLVAPVVAGVGVWATWKIERLRGAPGPTDASVLVVELDEGPVRIDSAPDERPGSGERE